MGILITIIVGAIVGWLAGVLMKARFGLLGCIIVGIVGSLLGHWLAGLIGIGAAGGSIGSLLISVLGAMVLIALIRAIK